MLITINFVTAVQLCQNLHKFNSQISVGFSSSNIGEFSKDVKMLAALEEEESDGDKLLDAARRLAGAISDMLTAAEPGTQEVRKKRIPC